MVWSALMLERERELPWSSLHFSFPSEAAAFALLEELAGWMLAPGTALLPSATPGKSWLLLPLSSHQFTSLGTHKTFLPQAWLEEQFCPSTFPPWAKDRLKLQGSSSYAGGEDLDSHRRSTSASGSFLWACLGSEVCPGLLWAL